MKKALLIIDLQNDYFPGGRFPLWNAEGTLANVERAITLANEMGASIVLIQHVADAAKGKAPFFEQGTEGVKIHQRILAAAGDAPVIVKAHADSFYQTNLAETLSALAVSELLICGMMTQNCVTHTAISKQAEAYAVTVLTDCCTTVDAMIHGIALNAMATRVRLASAEEAMGQ